MEMIFKSTKPFKVPDGTLVSPFLNSKDSESGLPYDLLNGFSIAYGVIKKGKCSKIHIMPLVTQVTFVLEGEIEIMMKSQDDVKPYTLKLATHQAALTKQGTFIQLINNSSKQCKVLYIVSPAYVFEKSHDIVIYDDSLILDEDWDQLAGNDWKISKQLPTMADRENTEARLSEQNK